jgi:hypothetical protein
MRRSLVLGDETARHPFLQSLPPHVRTGTRPVLRVPEPEANPTMLEKAIATARRRGHALLHALRGMNITAGDMRLFLLAYCACFMAVSAFIW